MPYFTPEQQQKLAQLDREYAQRKADLAQSFYQQQGNNWGAPSQMPMYSSVPPAPSQNVNWIQVPGVDGARNQIVQPGQTAWMMDNNQPYFYVKSVDNVGSSTLRIFHFDEVTDTVSEEKKSPPIDTSQYVQRAEFDELKAQIEQLTNTQKKQPAKAEKAEKVVNNG